MRHEIDLSSFQIHNDFTKIDGISVLEENKNGIKIYSVLIDKINARKLKKREGKYLTIEFLDITDIDNRYDVEKTFISKLTLFISELGINKDDSCLIIGLGNRNSTADSLGPLVNDEIIVTNHLFELTSVDESFRRTYKLAPGIDTGIDTSDYIRSIVKTIKPKFIIIIDSLVCNNASRVCKSIQITDSGIAPGSGTSKNDSLLSNKNLGVPVIAVGVPTVVLTDEQYMIIPNNLDFLLSKLSFIIGNGINKAIHEHKL